MDGKEFDTWLMKDKSFNKADQGSKYDICLGKPNVQSSPHCSKSDTLILPLSLEDNATTTGTAAIIEEFGKEFSVPCEHAKEYLPFDSQMKNFDINAVRRRQEFLASLTEHRKDMTEIIRSLHEAEKNISISLC